jgi:hypothetical protein
MIALIKVSAMASASISWQLLTVDNRDPLSAQENWDVGVILVSEMMDRSGDMRSEQAQFRKSADGFACIEVIPLNEQSQI